MKDTFMKMVEVPKAGQDRYDERIQAQKFLRLIDKEHGIALKTHCDRWFAWDGKRWKETPRESFRRWAIEALPNAHRSARNARSLIDHVEFSCQMPPGEELRGAAALASPNVVLLNVANGVLEVSAEHVTLRKHEKELGFTGVCAAAWVEEAGAPVFERTLTAALPTEEDRELLKWFSGYLLYPDAKQHELFLLCYGEGGTGKSTVAEAIAGVLSDERLVTGLSMTQICTSGAGSYSLPKLQHAMVNLGTELDTVELDESSNFKRIVSGETIEARTIYGKPFPMKTTAKLWFLANSLPRFKHGTEAELRRARFLCFDQKPTEKDLTLKDVLPTEKDGILRWMVTGLQKILAGEACGEGGEKSKLVRTKFAVSNDPVQAFVREQCKLTPKGLTKKDALWESFAEFLDAQGFTKGSKDWLCRALYERFPQIRAMRVRAGDAGKLEPGTYFQGIELVDQD